MLQHTIDIASYSDAELVIVVLGANADMLRKEVEKKAHITVNTRWKEGMASSIICGMHALLLISPSADAVLFMICDQPFVSSSLLNELISTHQATAKKIVASSYNNTMGIPALFDKIVFREVMKLKGDSGAKKLLKIYKDDVATIDFPQGNIDIDTEDDYEKLLNNQKHVL